MVCSIKILFISTYGVMNKVQQQILQRCPSLIQLKCFCQLCFCNLSHIFAISQLTSKIMYNDQQQDLNQQNHPIYQTIDNSYIETFADFIQLNQNEQFIFYQSLSSISFPSSKKNQIKGVQVLRFFLYSQEGNIAVPVSDTHWIYLKPNLSKVEMKLHQNMAKSVRNVNNDLNNSCFAQIIAQQESKEKTFLYNKNQKIQGTKETIYAFNAKETYKDQNMPLQCSYDLILFECGQKRGKSKLNYTICQKIIKSVEYLSYRHYGIAIPRIKLIQKGFQLNSFLINYQKQQLYHQNQWIIFQQIHKNSDELLIPLLIQHQKLIYLIGFENKKEKIIFRQQLIPILNEKIQKIEATSNLGSENIGTEGIKYICAEKWNNLRTLNLWWNMIGEQGARIISSGYFPLLRVLDLRKNYIGNSGLLYFWKNTFQSQNIAVNGCSYMTSFPNLQQLLLTDNNLSCVDQINSQIFPRLRQLQLQNNNLQINCPSSIYISSINTLKTLSLRNNKITGEGLNTLDLPNLQNLYLSNNLLTTCEPLSQAYLPKLKKLILSKNKLVQMRSLRKSIFSNSYQIKQIDLSDNEIKQIKGFQQINLQMLYELKFNNNRNKRHDVIKQHDKINNFSWIFKCQLSNTLLHALNEQKIFTHKIDQLTQLTIQTNKSGQINKLLQNSIKLNKLKIVLEGASFKLEKKKLQIYLKKMLGQYIILQ